MSLATRLSRLLHKVMLGILVMVLWIVVFQKDYMEILKNEPDAPPGEEINK